MDKKPLTPQEQEKILAMHALAEEEDFHALLGVAIGAGRVDVEAAYHAFVRVWHPDRFFARDVGELGEALNTTFIVATRAFEVLRDDRKRDAYEQERRSAGKLRAPQRPSSPPPPPPPLMEPEPVSASSSHEVRIERKNGQTRVVSEFKPANPLPPPKPAIPQGLEKVRAALAKQLADAHRYYLMGKEDFDAGRFSKAEGSLYLATRYAPKNTDYQALYQQAVDKAKLQRALQHIDTAGNLERMQPKSAINEYRKAIEYDPPNGVAYFRLYHLLKADGALEQKEALQLLRKAVMKEPKVGAYRLALAELYLELQLKANALREAEAAVELEPKNAAAKDLLKRVKLLPG